MQKLALGDSKSLELKKHVGLIHSTNKLSLLERKISNALLYHAYNYLLTRNEHTIHIPLLCHLIGYNSKDYKTIKKSLISLISTVLEWNLVDKDKMEEEGVWIASAMLADAKITGSICTYSYSNRMRELCYYPEFYGRLNMQVMSMFKSTYGLALYENCIRYQNINQTPWFDLPIYRKLMGVEVGKYEIFRDLNRRVIKPSVAEVNNYSHIYVEPEFKKCGKNVIAIRFSIQSKKGIVIIDQIKENNLNQKLMHRLMEDYGFSLRKVEEMRNQYNDTSILEKMAIIESSTSYKSGKIKNLAKYLEKALKENYQPPKSSKENLEKLKIRIRNDKKISQLVERNLQAYRSYQNKSLPNVFNALPQKQKIQIEKSFDNYISSTLYYNVFIKTGLESPLVCDRFGDFVRSSYPELLESLLSFEEFCKKNNEEGDLNS